MAVRARRVILSERVRAVKKQLFWLSAWLVLGCSGGAEPRVERMPEPSDEASTVEPAPVAEPAAPELDPGSACGRALACCRAYAGAIEDVVESSACAGPSEASEAPDADARCDAMKEGWRDALIHLRGEPPEACR